ncbi:hypothetical protein V1264_006326 [Littorina saxatilis]
MTPAPEEIFSTLIFLASCISMAKSSPEVIRSMHYEICPKGFIRETNQNLQSFFSLSFVDCVARCSEHPGCYGVNVCPGERSEQVRCSLTGEVLPGPCDDLTAGTSSPQCFHVTKDLTSNQVVCQNGGTPNGDKCDCTIHFEGRICNRLIRDCSEPFENGYNTTDYNGAFTIQPISAPNPFTVRCRFEYGGITLPFWRWNTVNFDKDWATLKAGFGDDLNINPDYENFFVGLENLHHLVDQAEYQMNIFMSHPDGKAGAIYNNFNIGPESTDFELTFDSFNDPSSYVDDGFAVSSGPWVFSAADHDVNGCYGLKGKAGWYGPGCEGYGTFSSGDFDWPVNGATKPIEWMMFFLVRMSPYDEE